MHLSHKRGDDLRLDGTLTDAAGDPVSVAANLIAAELERRGVVVPLGVTLGAGPGDYVLTLAPENRDLLTVGFWAGDVEFVIAEKITSSQTYALNVEQDVTNAP